MREQPPEARGWRLRGISTDCHRNQDTTDQISVPTSTADRNTMPQYLCCVCPLLFCSGLFILTCMLRGHICIASASVCKYSYQFTGGVTLSKHCWVKFFHHHTLNVYNTIYPNRSNSVKYFTIVFPQITSEILFLNFFSWNHPIFFLKPS